MGHAIYDLYFEGATLYIWIFGSIFLIWLVKFLFGRLYYFLKGRKLIQQYPEEQWNVTSLVTYAGDEAQYFELGMRTLREQRGLASHKIYLMMDGMDDQTQNDLLCLAIALRYCDRVFLTNRRKKRANLHYLAKAAEEAGDLAEIIHLADSDTIFSDDQVLWHLSQPYADPKVGGTTTYQRAHLQNTPAEKTGEILERARGANSMAACGLFRSEPCLPGRSIMFRRDAVFDAFEALQAERWGIWKLRCGLRWPFVWIEKVFVECKAGDDRFLTDWIHKHDYDSVFVDEAKVETLVGETFKKMFRQWMRWGTTSQGYVLRTLHWLPFKKPIAFLNHILDMYTAHAAVFLFWSWVWSFVQGDEVLHLPLTTIIGISFASLTLMFVAKNFWHFWEHPRDLLQVPKFLYAILVGVHIRVITIWTPSLVGVWGTRPGIDAVQASYWVTEYDDLHRQDR